MHRSGLALAGAQRTLEAWAKGEAPPNDNDGIVTAEEVGGLKLKGTWLVVLSACETGTGQAKAGEGVMGLRRGFIQAGAQNLLMTLWPISDETTVQIMLDFYDRAFASGNAPQSLLDVQREWLVKLRKEKGLLYAVNRAGPFIMSSQGADGLVATAGEVKDFTEGPEAKNFPATFHPWPLGASSSPCAVNTRRSRFHRLCSLENLWAAKTCELFAVRVSPERTGNRVCSALRVLGGTRLGGRG